MKKNVLWALMLAVGLVSCNNENEAPEVGGAASGETTFLSVSLKSAGSMSRANSNPESFEYGDENENKVENATFYFFDKDGGAYDVATGTNAIVVTAKDLTKNEETPAENIEAYSKVILVLKGKTATPPAKMVALLNVATPDNYKNKTLSQLQALTTDYKTTNGFVMSNSVYKNDLGEVVATQILPENIFTSPNPTGNEGAEYAPESDLANIKPVQIYVERVAAKVRVNVDATSTTVNVPADTENGVEAYSYKIYQVEGAENTYVKVLGWEVTNAAVTSNLLKDYADTELFTPVNNPTFFRSYWATTPTTANPTHNLKFNYFLAENSTAKAVGAEDYYHENTLTPTNTESSWFNDLSKSGATKASQLLVAAQLVDASGAAKEFAKWYGTDYENGDALKAAMINNAAKQIFIKDEENSTETETKYKSIAIGDVVFYQVPASTSYDSNSTEETQDRRYEVRVKADASKTYYYVDTEGKVVAYSNADNNKAVSDILATIEPAMIWTSGYTYYYTIINHYGDADGIVRNHIYDINIKKFKGLGTPVYDPEEIIVPEIPITQEYYHLTAQINVLSWALVSQEVELGK